MDSSFTYLAYGLGIRAAMPLPELLVGKAEEEVSIRFGRVDCNPPTGALEETWGYFSRAPGEDCLFWQGVGSFLICGGRDVVVDPAPGRDERTLRLFVLGPVLAVLLRQRGHLLLHASAVAVDGGAVLFLGNSGMGKSTTAAALHARGHRLVNDDVAVLWAEGSCPTILPGYPQLKLWPEVLVSLGDDPEKLPRWSSYSEKRTRSATHKFSSDPLPVKRIYVLDKGDVPEILPLRSREAFIELVRHTYGSDYGSQMVVGVGSASHFLKCTNLSEKVTVRGLRRPNSLSRLPDLARLVEEDLVSGE